MKIAFDPGKSTGVAYIKDETANMHTFTITWEKRFKRIDELLEKIPAGTQMFVEEYRIFNAAAAHSHIDQVLWGPEMISLLRYLAYRKNLEIVWLRPAVKAQWSMERVRSTYTIVPQSIITEHARDAAKLLAAGLAGQGVVKPEFVKE